MAWEKRGNREYYYRKKRCGNRVVSEYFGNGEVAHAIAKLDEYERQESKWERESFNEEKDAQRELDREIDRVGDNVRALTRARLLVAGYHTHKGQWRKKRNEAEDD